MLNLIDISAFISVVRNMNIMFLAAGFVIGSVIGSFINVAACRTMEERKWWGSERSVCDSCGYQLSYQHLIPIVSYIWLKGKCANCGSSIGVNHILSEIVCGILYAFLIERLFCGTMSPIIVIGLVTVPLFLFHSITDIKNMDLYNAVTILILLVGLIGRIVFTLLGYNFGLVTGLYGLIAGAAVFYIPYFFVKDGMGLGDVYLSGAIGMLIGFPDVIKFILISMLTAMLIIGILFITGKVKSIKEKVPLGPFLCLGAYITFFL